MNTKEHFESLAASMAEHMAAFDGHPSIPEEYFARAYDFVLCTFGLAAAKVDLAVSLINEPVGPEPEATGGES